MAVNVLIPTPLRKLTNDQESLSATAATIGEVISDLERQFPGFGARLTDESGNLRRFVNIYLNEEDIRFLAGNERKGLLRRGSCWWMDRPRRSRASRSRNRRPSRSPARRSPMLVAAASRWRPPSSTSESTSAARYAWTLAPPPADSRTACSS